MKNIKIDDTKLMKRIEAIAKNTDNIAEEIVVNLGTIAHKVARNTVPVDTGALKQSLTLEVDKQGTSTVATIGSSLEYAPHVEFGTVYQTPQPYLNPALRTAEQQADNVTKAVVNKYVK